MGIKGLKSYLSGNPQLQHTVTFPVSQNAPDGPQKPIIVWDALGSMTRLFGAYNRATKLLFDFTILRSQIKRTIHGFQSRGFKLVAFIDAYHIEQKNNTMKQRINQRFKRTQKNIDLLRKLHDNSVEKKQKKKLLRTLQFIPSSGYSQFLVNELRRQGCTVYRGTGTHDLDQDVATYAYLNHKNVYGIMSCDTDYFGFYHLPKHIKWIEDYKMKGDALSFIYYVPCEVWNSLNMTTEEEIFKLISITGNDFMKAPKNKAIKRLCSVTKLNILLRSDQATESTCLSKIDALINIFDHPIVEEKVCDVMNEGKVYLIAKAISSDLVQKKIHASVPEFYRIRYKDTLARFTEDNADTNVTWAELERTHLFSVGIHYHDMRSDQFTIHEKLSSIRRGIIQKYMNLNEIKEWMLTYDDDNVQFVVEYRTLPLNDLDPCALDLNIDRKKIASAEYVVNTTLNILKDKNWISNVQHTALDLQFHFRQRSTAIDYDDQKKWPFPFKLFHKYKKTGVPRVCDLTAQCLFWELCGWVCFNPRNILPTICELFDGPLFHFFCYIQTNGDPPDVIHILQETLQENPVKREQSVKKKQNPKKQTKQKERKNKKKRKNTNKPTKPKPKQTDPFESFKTYTVNGIGGHLLRLSGWDGDLESRDTNVLFGKNAAFGKQTIAKNRRHTNNQYGLGFESKREKKRRDKQRKKKLPKQLISVLNKMAPENFDAIAKQMMDLLIENAETKQQLNVIIGSILQQVIKQPIFGTLYVQLCNHLHLHLPELATICDYAWVVNDADVSLTFRKMVYEQTKELFEEYLRCYHSLDEQLDPQVHQLKLDEKKHTLFAMMVLVAELYNVELVKRNLVFKHVLNKLLPQQNTVLSDTDLEGVRLLFYRCGKTLDTKAKKLVDKYLQKLATHADKLVDEIKEMRRNQWKQRLDQDESAQVRRLEVVNKDTHALSLVEETYTQYRKRMEAEDETLRQQYKTQSQELEKQQQVNEMQRQVNEKQRQEIEKLQIELDRVKAELEHERAEAKAPCTVDCEDEEKEKTAGEYLREWNLDEYINSFIDDNGYDDIEGWEGVTMEELTEMNFEADDAKEFIKRTEILFRHKRYEYNKMDMNDDYHMVPYQYDDTIRVGGGYNHYCGRENERRYCNDEKSQNDHQYRSDYNGYTYRNNVRKEKNCNENMWRKKRNNYDQYNTRFGNESKRSERAVGQECFRGRNRGRGSGYGYYNNT
eukprot:725230_1